jgi:hypothetical protein
VADAKISALPSATVPLAGTEVLPVVQGGTTDKVTAADLLRQNGQTVTTSNPVLSLAQTWNAGGVTFTGLFFNATSTASASSSVLMELQRDSSRRFAVDKDGTVDSYSAFRVLNNGGFLSVGSGVDLYLYRDAANTWAQRNGTNAQNFNIYNTYTSGSVYERGVLGWAANFLELSTETLGTGTLRSIRIKAGGASNVIFATAGADRFYVSPTGNFLAIADNTYDIGASGATRPRNVFVANRVEASGDLIAGATGDIQLSGRIRLRSAGDGILALYNNASTDFSRLQFGGTTSSFPAIKRNGAAISVSLADDSGLANLVASTVFATNLRAQSNSGLITLGSADDVILNRDAADALALRNGTTSQTFRVYNTYTDASNHERLAVEWSSNSAYVRTQAAGTGTGRSLHIAAAANLFLGAGGAAVYLIGSSGHLTPNIAANAQDIGTTALPLRSGYFGTSIISGTLPTGLPTTPNVGAFGNSWALIGSDNVTDAASKRIRIGVAHYTNAEEPFTLIDATTNSTANTLNIGGGTGSGNAATSVSIYTAANNTTVTGTERWQINSSGHFLAATDATYDIGQSGATRPRNIYASNAFVAGGGIDAISRMYIYTGTAIPAGGTTGAGYRMSSTADFGVFFGSGAPTLSAAKGSLYLRSDGSGTGDRMYVNTNGSTTWTAVTTAA